MKPNIKTPVTATQGTEIAKPTTIEAVKDIHRVTHATLPTLKEGHERFFRIVENDMKPGDTLRGYQCELVEIHNGSVVIRTPIDKPNMFEFAQSAMLDLMDPRNHGKPANPSEFV